MQHHQIPLQYNLYNMTKRFLFLIALAFLAFSCRKKETDNETVTEETTIASNITSNRTLKTGNTYLLKNIVYVTNNATLTIEPGVRILCDKDTRATLVITRGSKISANGIQSNPIVFTSNATSPARGDWAGIVICGKAPVNSSFNGTAGIGEVEGGINTAEGYGLFGGTDAADNSGILKYVRIEYAGYAFLPDKEINSLTLAGVGSGTLIDNVQVSWSNDDSFEFFGGTVNATHLISYSALDDDFDTDNGYSGKVQFGIVLRDSSIADISKSNGFESDNDANGSAAMPQTKAVFSNMTIIGPRLYNNSVGNALNQAGAHIRRNSSISIYNSVILGFPIGILIDGSKGVSTHQNILNGTLNIKYTIVAGNTLGLKFADNTTTPTGYTSQNVIDWFNTSGFNNQTLLNTADAGITSMNYYAPNFVPNATSPLNTGAGFTDNALQGMQNVSYRGAVSQSDVWYSGWTRF